MQTVAQAPKQSAPAAAPAQAPATGTSLVSPQRRGNAAAQEQLGGDGVGAAQSGLRDHTTSASVSVSGRLPAHTVLGEADGNRISTDKDTGFSVGVGRSGIWASFHPALLVRPGSFAARLATGGISISQLFFDFKSGKASLSLDTGWTGDVLDWFSDFKAGIEQKFATAIQGVMPDKLKAGNYDPYTDPELGKLLADVSGAIAGAFPAGGGGGQGKGLLDQIQGPEINTHFTAKEASFPVGDKMLLKLKAGADISLNAAMEGSMGDALRGPKLKQLDLSTNGVSLEHKSAGLIAGLTIRSLSFGPDLSLRSFDYDLGAEDLAGGLKLLGLLVELRTGQDLGVRDTERPEFKAIRAEVDQKARTELPTLLRHQLLEHDHAVPGMSLSSMVKPQS